jgi:hypothetical protein
MENLTFFKFVLSVFVPLFLIIRYWKLLINNKGEALLLMSPFIVFTLVILLVGALAPQYFGMTLIVGCILTITTLLVFMVYLTVRLRKSVKR